MKRQILVSFFMLFCVLLSAQSADWLWANGAGGASSDRGRAIATDPDGNCYITGTFIGSVTFGATNLTSSGSDDIFIAKLDPYGNWIWVKRAGGADVDAGYGIDTDAEGNCYITGYFQGTAGLGGINLVSNGASDVFIAKLDTNGNWLWANNAGGTGTDIGNAISTDTDGNCFAAGYYQGTATFGYNSYTSNGSYDIFIAGLDTYGNWLWAKSAGGSSTDVAYGVSADADGNCFITGSFMSDASFGSTNLSSLGSADIFIAKLDSDSDWLWATRAGGNGSDTGNGIATDLSGNCYIAGTFSGTAGFGSTNITSAGGADIIITKLDPNGDWLWAKRAGGSSADTGYSVASDASGNCYITGFFSGTAAFGETNLTSSGANEIFSSKLDTVGNWLWVNRAGGSSLDIGYAIATDPNGNCYITGTIVGTATFGSMSINPGLVNDIFIAKSGLPYPLITTDLHGILDFGDVYLGTSSQPLALWIKNTGTADLVINTINLLQTNSPFSIQEITLPITVAAFDSLSINLLFTPQVMGAVTDSLFIGNNSHNHPFYALQLRGTAVFAEPMAPSNVTSIMNGFDAIITWDEVTQSVANTPIVPDFYFIYFNGSPDPMGLYYFLGRSLGTQFTHYDVGWGAEHMFYRVKAIKQVSRNIALLDRFIRPGMTEEEVSTILKSLE